MQFDFSFTLPLVINVDRSVLSLVIAFNRMKLDVLSTYVNAENSYNSNPYLLLSLIARAVDNSAPVLPYFRHSVRTKYLIIFQQKS